MLLHTWFYLFKNTKREDAALMWLQSQHAPIVVESKHARYDWFFQLNFASVDQFCFFYYTYYLDTSICINQRIIIHWTLQ